MTPLKSRQKQPRLRRDRTAGSGRNLAEAAKPSRRAADMREAAPALSAGDAPANSANTVGAMPRMLSNALRLWRKWVHVLRRKKTAVVAGNNTSDEIARLRRLLEIAEDRAWELRESEERYRSLCEAFGDIVLHRDAGGTLLFANRAFDEMFGPKWTRERGMGERGRFEPEIVEEETARDGLAVGTRELCLETVEGPRWFRWIDTPIRDERSGATAIRSVARDITNHKLAERALESARQRAEQANLAKSRFLATVSHEMRTPLNGILGMSALLADSPLSGEQRAYNDAIATSGTALLSLIEDMLDLTMIEAGRFEVKPEEVSIAKLVEEVSELLAQKAHDKGIDLACFVSAATPARVVCDAGRVRQVLVNLIGNAIKFTERGGVLLSVRNRGGESRNETGPASTVLEFLIADSGPGIDVDDRARIFEEFVQVDSASTRRHGGVGLGLSISVGIARRLGGDIGVASAPGRGSQFRFRLPVTLPGPVTAALPLAPPLQGRNILLVSSNRAQTVAIAAMAGEAGARVEAASTMKAAFAAMRAKAGGRDYDTVLLTYGIARNPARWFARIEKTVRPAPFRVVLIRPGDRPNLASTLAAGFDAYLVCPVRAASFVSVLANRRSDTAAHVPVAHHRQPIVSVGDKFAQQRILLAEDNDINALLVAKTLERAGQSVTIAANGREAVKLYRAAAEADDPFAIVLMDLHMPVLDGHRAIAAIRRFESRKHLKPVRIYALSADAQDIVAKSTRAAGADGFLTKPVKPDQLIDLLRDLRRRQA